ncbi:hypothetical protein EYF80_013907 [Liparis tanakae]|uniref:Uncharacterized protein n=1 Tax=Liparis tanakae TaxID=230148 RepID=A0A4Z2IDF1_9TELE|nr:hypothetical protein EYF80_013907 [Liparis tanakae]
MRLFWFNWFTPHSGVFTVDRNFSERPCLKLCSIVSGGEGDTSSEKENVAEALVAREMVIGHRSADLPVCRPEHRAEERSGVISNEATQNNYDNQCMAKCALQIRSRESVYGTVVACVRKDLSTPGEGDDQVFIRSAGRYSCYSIGWNTAEEEEEEEEDQLMTIHNLPFTSGRLLCLIVLGALSRHFFQPLLVVTTETIDLDQVNKIHSSSCSANQSREDLDGRPKSRLLQ